MTASADDSDSDVDRRSESASFRDDSASLFRNSYEKKLVSKRCVGGKLFSRLLTAVRITVEMYHSTV